MRILSKLNTYYRLLVLILFTSSLFIILYFSLYFYTLKQEKEVYKSVSQEYYNEINSIFKLNSKAHISSVYYVSFWDELVDFTKTKNLAWYDEFIASEFEAYEVDYIGVYDLHGKLLSKSSTQKINVAEFIPKEVFPKLYQSKLIRFYLKIPNGIVEVFGATIHPTDDPKKIKTKPSGYFMMARLLDQSFINSLEEVSSSNIELGLNQKSQNQDRNYIDMNLNLKDWQNNLVSVLYFKRSFNLNFSNTKQILNIIIIGTIFNLLIYLYYYRRWIYKPLKLITNILERKDEGSIISLKKSKAEFAYIGYLFEENNNQRKQLMVAKEKAEEGDRLKSSFLANLSHEIRTPMNAIMGFSDLLTDTGLNEKDKSDYLSIIRNSGKNLISIIEDLIEMSKIDSKQIAPNYTFLNLDNCIAELHNAIRITIPEGKHISFLIEDQPIKLKGKILTDSTKLKQIITNLITNAIKFTKNGFVKIGYHIDENEGMIEIWVEDTGLGIDDSNLHMIFERFRRVEDDFTIELSGLGLGLSITKAYVELLGGEIKVKSVLGVGSRFSFTHPLAYQEQPEHNMLNQELKIVKESNNKTILIAEDDHINFLLFQKILLSKNHHVLRAVNGKKAIEICQSNVEIDLVFMDIKMPIVDGFEAFKKIRSFNKELPIIANTAYSSAEDKEKIVNAGFTAYITKPLNKTEVFDLLEQLWGSSN